jgi:hypothetical protein
MRTTFTAFSDLFRASWVARAFNRDAIYEHYFGHVFAVSAIARWLFCFDEITYRRKTGFVVATRDAIAVVCAVGADEIRATVASAQHQATVD